MKTFNFNFKAVQMPVNKFSAEVEGFISKKIINATTSILAGNLK